MSQKGRLLIIYHFMTKFLVTEHDLHKMHDACRSKNIKILEFFGSPGNGKSFVANCLADKYPETFHLICVDNENTVYFATKAILNLRLAKKIFRILPPRLFFSSPRLFVYGVYIISCYLRGPNKRILLLDQGFAQFLVTILARGRLSKKTLTGCIERFFSQIDSNVAVVESEVGMSRCNYRGAYGYRAFARYDKAEEFILGKIGGLVFCEVEN